MRLFPGMRLRVWREIFPGLQAVHLSEVVPWASRFWVPRKPLLDAGGRVESGPGFPAI